MLPAALGVMGLSCTPVEEDDGPGRIRAVVRSVVGAVGLPAWVRAQPPLIGALARGQDLFLGPRNRWVGRVFRLLGTTVFASLVLRAFAVIHAWAWLRAARRAPCGAASTPTLLLGMGAGAEPSIHESIVSETGAAVTCLEQNNPSSLGAICCPSLSCTLGIAWGAAAAAHRALARTSSPWIRCHMPAWMAATAMGVGPYAFFRAWVECLPAQVTRLIFLAVDIPAAAALDAQGRRPEIRVEHRQHGFHRLSIPIPRFDRIVSLDWPEAEHFRAQSGCPEVEVVPRVRCAPRPERAPRLLLASSYDVASLFSRRDHLPMLTRLFAWARERGLEVVVRPHPREDPGFWTTHFPDTAMDDRTSPFLDSLARWQPSAVVSWASTALLDALGAGVLPLLLREGSEPLLEDCVFPVDQVALVWPEDAPEVSALLARPQDYDKDVAERYAKAFFGADSAEAGLQVAMKPTDLRSSECPAGLPAHPLF